MIIKITEINDSNLGSFEAKEIVGDRIDGQGEWRKKCFANNKELMDQLSEFGVGEIVNVRCVKGKGTNKYGKPNYNVSGFEEASEELINTVKGSADANPSKGSGNFGASAYSKSTWNGRTGDAYDRSASVYLAWDMLTKQLTPAQLKKVEIKHVIELANKINGYIHDGDDGIDPLTPPVIDDDIMH